MKSYRQYQAAVRLNQVVELDELSLRLEQQTGIREKSNNNSKQDKDASSEAEPSADGKVGPPLDAYKIQDSDKVVGCIPVGFTFNEPSGYKKVR